MCNQPLGIMNQKGSLHSNMAISLSIRYEIQRFESVHPSIYALYDMIENVGDELLQLTMREHIIHLEDSFVNSSEWTLHHEVSQVRLGVVGTGGSGRSSLVHRYLTGFYVPDESPEGGRFKKELVLNGASSLMHIRDEAGPPEMQFTNWVDAVVFVFSLENEVSFNTIYSYYAKMSHYRNMQKVPVILVGLQDAISETRPRVVSDASVRRLVGDLRQCQYFEACATYGLNVDKIFEEACLSFLEREVPAAGGLPQPGAPVPIPGQVALRSYQTQLSQSNMGRDFESTTSYSSIPSVMSSSSNNANHLSQGHSPPFRDMTPSGGESDAGPPPPQRPERRNKHPPNKNREKNVFQLENELGLKQFQQLTSSSDQSCLKAQANSQVAQNFLSQQGHELVDMRELGTPFSTPSLARKKISSSVQKSSSFSTSGLLRHGSQLSLQIDMRELPSAGGSVGWKEKFTKRIGDRIDLFFKEFQTPKERAPLTPLLSRIPRHRSYSIQLAAEQSADNNRELTTPNTTPTPGRKDRRRSNIFTGKKDEKLKNGDPIVGSGRVIPIKQGYLYKRSNKPLNKDWQKKYVTLLDDGRLTYHSSLHDYMENSHGKEIKLIQTTVKIPGQRPRGSETSLFQPPNPSKQGSGQSSRSSQEIAGNGNDQNVDAVVIQNSGLKSEIDSLSLSSTVPPTTGLTVTYNNGWTVTKAETPMAKKKHRRIKSSSKNIDISKELGGNGYEFVIVSLDNKQWHFEAATPEEREEWITSIEHQILSSLQLIKSTKASTTSLANKAAVQTMRSVAGNASCADCGAPNPDWASLNLCELICIECSGIHRNLGTHLSRVRSLELDEWPQELVDVMTSVGNSMANSIWEANTHQQPKPSPSSSREEKEKWIRRKYEQRDFLPPLPYKDVPIPQQLMDAVARVDISATILVLAYSTPDHVVTPHSEKDTRTALHIAAALGNVVLVQLLIWNGANVEQLDHEGHNAAFYAAATATPSTKCIKLLQPHQCSTASTLPRDV